MKAIIIFFLLLLPTEAFPEQAVQKDIVRVPAGELKPLNSQLIEQFQWDVRGTTPADTEILERQRAYTQSFLGSSLGISALSVAEAIAIPGFFSGSLVAGAIIIAPLAITLSVMQHRQYETIQRALQETSLLDLARESLKKRATKSGLSIPGAPKVELIIVAHGLTQQPLCLFVDAAITITVQGNQIFEDIIYLEPFLRSSDAPPPICGSIEDFAKDDGRLIKRGLIEYGQVLAAIVIKRTKAFSWQD
jgi:hypothetical protein